MQMDKRKEIIQQQISAMTYQIVGLNVFNPEITAWALDVILSLDADIEGFNMSNMAINVHTAHIPNVGKVQILSKFCQSLNRWYLWIPRSI